MVVGDVDCFELGEVVENLKGALGRDIHLNLYTPAEWDDLQSDRVTRAIKSEPRIMVAGARSTRTRRSSKSLEPSEGWHKGLGWHPEVGRAVFSIVAVVEADRRPCSRPTKQPTGDN